MKKSLITLAIFSLGVLLGGLYSPIAERVYAIRSGTHETVTEEDLAPFWKAWDLLDANFEDTHTLATTSIASSAVEAATTTGALDTQTRVWGAIKGLAASYGDPYTVFFDPIESKSFGDTVKGEFDGIGLEVTQKEGILTAVTALKGTPAERAGILPDDKILKINNDSTEGMSIEKAVSLIKGKKGTKVELTLYRPAIKEKNPIIVSIVRDKIESPVIETKKQDGVFIITLYSFSETSPKLFQNALKEFVDSGMSKLVLDLRNNPGGYLEASVSMASWFLPEGTPIVREVRKGKEKVYRSFGYDVFTPELKFVILVNGGSASAAEILAGALSENGKAMLVGEKTFGKGTVQELLPVTEDTSIKITVAKWFTPKGVSISHEGIVPETIVTRSFDDIKNKKDPQLQKALELLTTK